MRKNIISVILVTVLGLLGASSAFAEGFDPATAISSMSGAAATVATLVAGIVAVGAGLAVYRKVKSFFGKAN